MHIRAYVLSIDLLMIIRSAHNSHIMESYVVEILHMYVESPLYSIHSTGNTYSTYSQYIMKS